MYILYKHISYFHIHAYIQIYLFKYVEGIQRTCAASWSHRIYINIYICMSFPKGDSTLYRQNHMDFDCGNIFCNPSNDWDTWHTNTGNVEYILFWDNQHGRKPSCNPDFIQDRSTVFFSNTLPQVAYASRLSVPQVDTRHQLHVPLEQRVRQLCFCKGKGGQSKMEF